MPDLLVGTLNVLLLVATVPPTLWVDRPCRKQFDELAKHGAAKPSEVRPENGEPPPERPRAVLLVLLALFLLGCVSLVLRWYEFPALHVRWNENAYAALVWSRLGLHFLYIVIEVIEVGVLLLWTWMFGRGENMATDVMLTAAYWYWTVGVGVVISAVVYWFPRLA